MKDHKGFTLIEVLVAVALLGLVIATLMELFSANLRSSRKTSEYTQAIILAQSEMEKLYSNNIEPGSEKESSGRYTVIRDIKPLEEISEQLKTYEIRITVLWDNNRYELMSFKLQTEVEKNEE